MPPFLMELIILILDYVFYFCFHYVVFYLYVYFHIIHASCNYSAKNPVNMVDSHGLHFGHIILSGV